jgi:hypothetical protein
MDWSETIWLDTFKTWVRALTEIVGVQCAGIAITDLRFLIEMRGIKEIGGKILHLQAPDEQATLAPELRGHRSETELESPAGFRTLYWRERYHHEGHRMKHLDFSLTMPAGLLIVFCGFALLFGTDHWRLARIFALSLPSAAYVVISHGLLSMTGQGRRGLWHGGSLALYVALTAAGFCIVVVTGQLQRWLGGAS